MLAFTEVDNARCSVPNALPYHGQAEHLAITSGPMELVADVQTRITTSERRLNELEEQIQALESKAPKRVDIANALAEFDELWSTMKPAARNELIENLIDRIDYDGVAGPVEIHFHPTGISTLAQQPQDATA